MTQKEEYFVQCSELQWLPDLWCYVPNSYSSLYTNFLPGGIEFRNAFVVRVSIEHIVMYKILNPTTVRTINIAARISQDCDAVLLSRTIRYSLGEMLKLVLRFSNWPYNCSYNMTSKYWTFKYFCYSFKIKCPLKLREFYIDPKYLLDFLAKVKKYLQEKVHLNWDTCSQKQI